MNLIRQVHHPPPVKKNSQVHHPTLVLPLPLQVETIVGVQQGKKKKEKRKKRIVIDETLRATTNA